MCINQARARSNQWTWVRQDVSHVVFLGTRLWNDMKVYILMDDVQHIQVSSDVYRHDVEQTTTQL